MITIFFSTAEKRKVDGNNNDDVCKRQKKKPAEASKEQPISASLKTVRKWEKELHTPLGFIKDAESRNTVVEFWCEICRTFAVERSSQGS